MLGPFVVPSADPIADAALAELILIVSLFVMLVIKQLVSPLDTLRARQLGSILAIPIVPLLIAFVAVAVSRSAELMRL